MPLLAWLALAACVAWGQGTAAAERDLAVRFGLTPGQTRTLYLRLDATSALLVQAAQEAGIHVRTLRAAALELGARNPGLSVDTFVQLVRGRAKDAAEQKTRIKALQQTLKSLDPSGERTHALALVKEAQDDFDAGRLQQAETTFGRLSLLRQSELAGARKAWLTAMDLQAESAMLRADASTADRVLSEKSAELRRQRHEAVRDQWLGKVCKTSRQSDWHET